MLSGPRGRGGELHGGAVGHRTRGLQHAPTAYIPSPDVAVLHTSHTNPPTSHNFQPPTAFISSCPDPTASRTAPPSRITATRTPSPTRAAPTPASRTSPEVRIHAVPTCGEPYTDFVQAAVSRASNSARASARRTTPPTPRPSTTSPQGPAAVTSATASPAARAKASSAPGATRTRSSARLGSGAAATPPTRTRSARVGTLMA